MHISYNEEQLYFSASAIKAPVALFLYKQADDGKVDLDSYIEYTSNFYVEGSGDIQYTELGTQYQLRELVQKAIVDSDNVAYEMISSISDELNIKDYWNKKGANNFWNYSVWVNITAKDATIYMKELYNYYLTDSKLSNELINYFYNSVSPLITSKNNDLIAHKSGCRGDIIHDTAIVFNEYPYVLAIMTNKGYADYEEFFNEASQLIAEFHEIYWKNKSNFCYTQAF